jgi:hypothetical protein
MVSPSNIVNSSWICLALRIRFRYLSFGYLNVLLSVSDTFRSSQKYLAGLHE